MAWLMNEDVFNFACTFMMFCFIHLLNEHDSNYTHNCDDENGFKEGNVNSNFIPMSST